MSKNCTHCGAVLSEEAIFCQFCGTKKEKLGEKPIPEIATSLNRAAVPATQGNRRKKVLLICGIVTVFVALLFLIFGSLLNNDDGASTDGSGSTSKKKAPFFGIERGDSVERVEKKMGDPDDFDDNGMRNYNYYYEDIEFLDMEGYVDIHFELDKVDVLSFVYSSADMSDYEDVMEYYTDRYGEPLEKHSDYLDYYYDSECAFWEIDNSSIMQIEYHSGGQYEGPTLKICIYN